MSLDVPGDLTPSSHSVDTTIQLLYIEVKHYLTAEHGAEAPEVGVGHEIVSLHLPT